MSTVDGTKQLTCPHCGHQDRYQIAHDTQTVWCPKCQAKITLTRKRREAEPARVPSPPPMPRKVVAEDIDDAPSLPPFSGLDVSLSILLFGLSGAFLGYYVPHYGMVGDGLMSVTAEPFSPFRYRAATFYLPVFTFAGLFLGFIFHAFIEWNKPRKSEPIYVSTICVLALLLALLVSNHLSKVPKGGTRPEPLILEKL